MDITERDEEDSKSFLFDIFMFIDQLVQIQ